MNEVLDKITAETICGTDINKLQSIGMTFKKAVSNNDENNDVDFITQEEYKGMVGRDKVPYGFLESGKSSEEHVMVHSGIPRKFKVTTTWTDKQGDNHSKEQIVMV